MMLGAPISAEQLWEALHDALARVHEFDDLDSKLGEFGLNPEQVYDVLQTRWQQYRDDHEGTADGHVIFVRAFVEGLLTGLQLGRRHE